MIHFGMFKKSLKHIIQIANVDLQKINTYMYIEIAQIYNVALLSVMLIYMQINIHAFNF